jgi:UDP-N-acetylglucosamine 4,6-dehydratase/5-epimerase
LGDIRDRERLNIACSKVDLIIHTAALKQADTAEYNPIEYIKTNILGAQNLIEVSHYNKIKKIISIPTDKASSSINLYGATKLCSDKLFLAANNYVPNKIFSVIKYGNVISSRGSVIPLLKKQLKNKENLTITDKKMTRFSLELNKFLEIIKWSIKNSIGEEIIIPKLKSYNILDLVKARCASIKPKPQ